MFVEEIAHSHKITLTEARAKDCGTADKVLYHVLYIGKNIKSVVDRYGFRLGCRRRTSSRALHTRRIWMYQGMQCLDLDTTRPAQQHKNNSIIQSLVATNHHPTKPRPQSCNTIDTVSAQASHPHNRASHSIQ
ncbi:MAG TPA: hypothetical protein VLC92_15440 [Rhodocyclaceae bacterium]|nr:hypothetical protein [Rhodocyclaceae bacterium]